MLTMIFGLNIFINSGILDFIFRFLNITIIPKEIFPMILLRPISGNATLVILNNLYKLYTPDSYISFLGSIIQGSTDTTFYVITLYFGSVGIKKIRYSFKAGLFADLVGIISAIVISKIMF